MHRIWVVTFMMTLGGFAEALAQRPAPQGAVREIALGPDAIETVVLKSPMVLYRIGARDGHEMVTMPIWMMPIGANEVLLQYNRTREPAMIFQRDSVRGSVGRIGKGPGEYLDVTAFAFDPTNRAIWLFDRRQQRAVVFSKGGKPLEVVSLSSIGRFAGAAILSDGRVVVNGSGAQQSAPSQLHVYDPKSKRWSAHLPWARGSAPPMDDFSKWVQRLWATKDGKLISTSHAEAGLLEIIDPGKGFSLETRIRRRPAGWPENVDKANEELRKKNGAAPFFGVEDVHSDPRGRIWILSVMPEKGWAKEATDTVELGGGHGRGVVYGSDDKGQDTLIEVIDLKRGKVLVSYRLDAYCRWILQPGVLGCLAGEDPSPQVAIVQVPVP